MSYFAQINKDMHINNAIDQCIRIIKFHVKSETNVQDSPDIWGRASAGEWRWGCY